MCYIIEMIQMITPDWLMFFATFAMAIFAFFSWQTAKKSAKTQTTLLEHQNIIQEKQHNLALLKDMLSCVEDFRIFILNKKEILKNELYVCGTIRVSYESFRDDITLNYHIMRRIEALFGKELKTEAFALIRVILDAFPDVEFVNSGLVINGCMIKNPTSNNEKRILAYRNQQENLRIEAEKMFGTILEKFESKINKISKQLNTEDK